MPDQNESPPCTETPTPDHNDPIPFLPLPHWLEKALVQAVRILLGAALGHFVKGNCNGTRNV